MVSDIAYSIIDMMSNLASPSSQVKLPIAHGSDLRNLPEWITLSAAPGLGVESESGGPGLEAVSGQTVEDVRVRVARRKRERMRERLLSAALSIFLSDRGGDAAIAEDVMKAAGVSRGTFYKYFNSVEEAADAVGQRLADEAVRELIRAFSGQERAPIERAALGAQMLMSRAVVQPAWGGFVSRSGHLSQDSTYAAAVRRTTLDGRASGDFNFKSTKAAVDFQIGAVMEGVRRIVAGQPHPRAYLCEVATMTLKGLGADHHRSDAASAKASRDLSIIGPQHLPWWRDFNWDRRQLSSSL